MTQTALDRIARATFAILAAAQLACGVAPLPEAAARPTPILQPAIVEVDASARAVTAPPPAPRAVEGTASPEAETPVAAPAPFVSRRMKPSEVTTAHGLEAKRILKSTYHLPMGSEVPFELGGQDYVAKIELHWHEPHVHPLPWGWHRGISLYVMVPAG